VVAIMARQLLKIALFPLDAAGPSRSRLALRRIGLRFKPYSYGF
jgi:hypothetical protein